MRKILFLSHRIPFPPTKGDKIRSFHILRHLASYCEIYLGSFFDDPDDQEYVQALRSYCAQVFVLPIRPAWKMARAAGAVISGGSISAAVYKDPSMARWVSETLNRHDIHDIFIFCSSVAPYVWNDSRRRLLIDFVDVDSEKWGQYSRSGNPLLRALFSLEQRRVLQLEKRAGSCCAKVLLASAAEATLFRSLAPELSDRILTMHNGVDSQAFDPDRTTDTPYGSGSRPVVFTGAMDYRPNAEAAAWFVDEIFPRVRETIPDSEFWIVGRNPTKRVRRLAEQPHVHVTGTVDDVRPYFHYARCAVAPLRTGRGIQNKILEAMAMAKPVVATATALEGVRAEPMREVLKAKDATDFARLVVEVLSGKWESVGNAARARMLLDYDWSKNLQILDQLLCETANTEETMSAAGVPVHLVIQQ